MLVKDLATIFQSLAKGASLHRDEEAERAFRAIAAALGAQRRSLKLKDAETYWREFSLNRPDSQRDQLMTARRAAEHLRIVSETANPIARKGALNPLREFVDFLQERGDANVVSIVSDVVRPRPKKDWLVELKAAGTNRAAFDSALDQMNADKAIDIDALNRIAEEYTGASRKSRSRKETLERIRDQFEADAQYASKVDAIDRMTGGKT